MFFDISQKLLSVYCLFAIIVCKMTDKRKIEFRLVYNRKKRSSRMNRALIQVEAYYNMEKVYFSTHIYMAYNLSKESFRKILLQEKARFCLWVENSMKKKSTPNNLLTTLNKIEHLIIKTGTGCDRWCEQKKSFHFARHTNYTLYILEHR